MPSVEQLFEEAEMAAEMPETRENVDLGNGISGESWVQRPGGTSNRLVPVYDTKTGVETRILPYMIPGVMQMKHRDDGTRMYEREQRVKPKVGTYMCLLNPDHPKYADTVEAGVTVITCKRATLQSEFDVENHMRYVHPKEYSTIEKFVAERDRAEQREFQKLQTELLKQQLAGGSKRGTS